MNSKQAFERLFASIRTALSESLKRHSRAALQGDLTTLDAETDLQRNLVAARNQLQRLQDTWPLPVQETSTAPESETPKPAKRSARGRKLKPWQQTPERAYYVPILQALEEMGGRGSASSVVNRVGEILADDLTEHDRGTLKTGPIRWRNAARWARNSMKEQGLLADNSPAGIWEMTEQGRRYLRERER